MNKKIKILALMTDAYGGYGGIAQANRDILEAWSEMDFIEQVVVIPRNGKASSAELPEKIHQTNPVFSPAFYGLKSLWIAFTQGPFDFIFCGHFYMTPLCWFIHMMIQKPFWLHLHGTEVWDGQGILRCVASQKAKIVTCVSRYTRKRFLSWASFDPNQTKVLPNTVRDIFQHAEKSEEFMKRFDLIGKKILITTGRISSLDRYKGHEDIIRLMPELLLQNPHFTYLVVGDGDDRVRLEKLSLELKVHHSVQFTGYLSDADLVKAYQSSDLFLMPSTGEGFGIVFLEAMFCGLPVLAGSSDGSVDPLQDGYIGILHDGQARLFDRIIDICNKSAPKDELMRKAKHFFGRGPFAENLSKLVKTVA